MSPEGLGASGFLLLLLLLFVGLVFRGGFFCLFFTFCFLQAPASRLLPTDRTPCANMAEGGRHPSFSYSNGAKHGHVTKYGQSPPPTSVPDHKRSAWGHGTQARPDKARPTWTWRKSCLIPTLWRPEIPAISETEVNKLQEGDMSEGVGWGGRKESGANFGPQSLTGPGSRSSSVLPFLHRSCQSSESLIVLQISSGVCATQSIPTQDVGTVPLVDCVKPTGVGYPRNSFSPPPPGVPAVLETTTTPRHVSRHRHNAPLVSHWIRATSLDLTSHPFPACLGLPNLASNTHPLLLPTRPCSPPWAGQAAYPGQAPMPAMLFAVICLGLSPPPTS
ncbi:uncharacterized protein LOC128310985 [Acinonyx jubatus]|uniref:Uncharacterized protein LOC128310985 n=1 Tax=Acinonyx jubatus TaxID=32536 RepID=A0ABM3PBU7_ACIJB|nr:uncharacterized protein LOC128310985 [Acinonyx jubatus]XP_053069150.1 uncharacterized protein LOC128310985 [Acinonyx jubatus]XP_053069151.1 uncharacterized protein LOC128310985 [Acinonyx jubatus]XP_053069152.1 uncharacterized protein LOC128310985 [Acinonyx jubatus]XP_053069153.1 uncharacterized protein LOC128310985 [Acinonyx jubatus]XP_053069154.1 uncharacterized protein LOC128310985 [Acinonyx jubatus]